MNTAFAGKRAPTIDRGGLRYRDVRTVTGAIDIAKVTSTATSRTALASAYSISMLYAARFGSGLGRYRRSIRSGVGARLPAKASFHALGLLDHHTQLSSTYPRYPIDGNAPRSVSRRWGKAPRRLNFGWLFFGRCRCADQSPLCPRGPAGRQTALAASSRRLHRRCL